MVFLWFSYGIPMCDVRLFFLSAAIARLARHLRQRLEERQLRGVVGRQDVDTRLVRRPWHVYWEVKSGRFENT